MNYHLKGREDGEAAGFRDGIEGNPLRPWPDLAPSLASIVYRRAYTAAYEVAFSKGRDAKEQILNWRANTDAVRALDRDGRERGDV